MRGADDDIVIRVRGLVTRFGAQTVHDGLDLDVRRGEVIGVVGGSGSGKSVLLRSIVGLRRPQGGSIEVLGRDVLHADEAVLRALEQRWGVLFQDGALFSSLTVMQNIEVPLREHCPMPEPLMDEIAACKIALVGLPEADRRQIPVAAVGRHAQARRARAGAGARPRNPVSRRADRRSRPDRRRRVRPADRRSEGEPRADRVSRHARSRYAVRDLRPRRGAGRQQDTDRYAGRSIWRTRIPGCAPIFTVPAPARGADSPGRSVRSRYDGNTCELRRGRRLCAGDGRCSPSAR